MNDDLITRCWEAAESRMTGDNDIGSIAML